MKRRTLALILAAALTVTSVEGTAVMASAAEFTSEAAEEENTGQESETDTFSSDFAEQEGEIASEEIGITDEETQEEEAADDEISILDEADDGEDEEKIEITDGTIRKDSLCYLIMSFIVVITFAETCCKCRWFVMCI